MNSLPTSPVHIRVLCVDPPVTHAVNPAISFGLQDKKTQLLMGTPLPDGSLRFDCEILVKRDTDGTPNFMGPYAHGSKQQRFLYLTLMHHDGDIIRRIKVQLGTITWAQVEQALEAADLVLQAAVSGQKSGTVPLLGEGWVVR